MNYWRCEACGRANKTAVLVCDGCGSPIPLSYDNPRPLTDPSVFNRVHDGSENEIPKPPKPSRTGIRLA